MHLNLQYLSYIHSCQNECPHTVSYCDKIGDVEHNIKHKFRCW